MDAQTFYLYAKIIAATGSALGTLYGLFSWLRKTYQQAQKTSNNVELLMTNHFPHVQASLDAHGVALSTLSSEVRDVGTKVDGMEQRQEDLRKGVHTLGESFLRHLENAAQDKPRKKRKT